MPGAWSSKDERQYDHIRQSNLERGASEDRAEEIAARTVNKTRRKQGRTPKKATQGTGNPNRPYADRTKRELYDVAKKMKIEGRGNMDKQELISAIQNHR